MFKVSSESDYKVLHGETAWNADGRIQVCGNAYVSYEVRLVYALIDSFSTILNFKSMIN